MNDETPAWAKDFTPRQNVPKPQEIESSFPCKACGWSGPNHALDGMTQGEIRAYGKKLSYAALIEIVADKSQPGATRKACAELLIERDEGKSPEVVNQNVNVVHKQIRVVFVEPAKMLGSDTTNGLVIDNGS